MKTFISDKFISNAHAKTEVDQPVLLTELLLQKLTTGIVVFCYMTSKGIERYATGTLNAAMIPLISKEQLTNMENGLIAGWKVIQEVKKPKDERDQTVIEDWKRCKDYVGGIVGQMVLKRAEMKKERVMSSLTQHYWDFDAMAWRSYNVDSIISLVHY